jgi:bifunctional non-homologous end joining protein LigD
LAGVRLSHPERVLIPDPGVTKLELASYYQAVAPRLLPHVVDRPLSIVRCPEGQGVACFYQKHLAKDLPGSVDAIDVPGVPGSPGRPYLGIHDLSGLLELVQRGTIELHPWGARRDLLGRPDRIVIDLDPGPGVPWRRVVEAAHELRALAEELGLSSFARTTGGKGLHVVLPIARRSTWEEAKAFARALGQVLARRDERAFVLSASKRLRRGRIFVDYLRNARGATAIAPYSARARPGAAVATPVAWDELTTDLDPAELDVRSVLERLKSSSDPWADYFDVRQALTRSVLSAVGDLE